MEKPVAKTGDLVVVEFPVCATRLYRIYHSVDVSDYVGPRYDRKCDLVSSTH